LRAAALRTRGPFVRDAFFAAADRCDAGRCRAAVRACRASARGEAAEWPSRRSARLTAVDRRRDGRPFARFPPLDRAVCFDALALLPFCLGNFTPARRAFDRPIAIACFVDRAPCFPSRT